MENILLEDHNEVGILRLDNGVTNSISPQMVTELCETLPVLEKEFRGLVIAGGVKFFSMGFDLPHLLRMPRDEFENFFFKFNQAILSLLTLCLPTCCAIEGHAVAGGCILALGCDYRFAAPQRKIGLNEIRLGVPVPYLADLMLRQISGDRAATDMAYSGAFVSTADAATTGLVDELCAPGAVVEKAFEKIARIAACPRAAFSAIKADRVASIRLNYEAHGESKNKVFFDCWFGAAAQELLREAARKFQQPG